MRLIAAGVATFVLVVAVVAASRVRFDPPAVSAEILIGVDATATAPGADPPGPEAAPPVSPVAALAIAKAAAPSASVVAAPDLVDAQGSLAYEIPLDRGTIYVDASTGSVLANTTLAASSDDAVGDKSDHDSRSKDSHHSGKEHDDDDDDDD